MNAKPIVGPLASHNNHPRMMAYNQAPAGETMSTDLRQPIYSVRHLRNILIPMADGVRLSADLFMPDGQGPFPGVFEFLPYRKDDRTAPRWNAHQYFAERGFVGVRADIRGTGGSEGVATDEYTPQEQQDACQVIDWASRQPWCNG